MKEGLKLFVGIVILFTVIIIISSCSVPQKYLDEARYCEKDSDCKIYVNCCGACWNKYQSTDAECLCGTLDDGNETSKVSLGCECIDNKCTKQYVQKSPNIAENDLSESSRDSISNEQNLLDRPIWYAPYVYTPLPRIDANVNSSEISDAYAYIVPSEDPDDIITFYVKTIARTECNKFECILKDYLYISYVIIDDDITPNSFTGMKLYFDEGWPQPGECGGTYNDMIMTNCEDLKEIQRNTPPSASCEYLLGYNEGCPEPQCDPYLGNDCWSCQSIYNYTPQYWYGESCIYSPTGKIAPALFGKKTDVLDGYAYSSGGFWVAYMERERPLGNIVHYIARAKELDQMTTGEFLIPLKGLNGGPLDYSDIQAAHYDVLGLHIQIFNYGVNYIGFPPGSEPYDPTYPVQWALLYLNDPRPT